MGGGGGGEAWLENEGTSADFRLNQMPRALTYCWLLGTLVFLSVKWWNVYHWAEKLSWGEGRDQPAPRLQNESETGIWGWKKGPVQAVLHKGQRGTSRPRSRRECAASVGLKPSP